MWVIRGRSCVGFAFPVTQIGYRSRGDLAVQVRDRKGTVTMTPQLVLVAAAFVALPVIGKVIKAIIELFVKLIAGAVTVVFVMFVLMAFVTHGKLGL